MEQIKFGIIGGGWRSRFYLRIARALPKKFKIVGMVVRNEEKGRVLEKDWGVKTYRQLDDFLKVESPEFVVVSVPWNVAPVMTKKLTERGVPILSETPPAPDLAGLKELYQFIQESGAKYQVAEQYHLQPLQAARIQLANSGILGEVSQVQISVCHWYHAISLIRKLMGIKFENAAITAHQFTSPIIDGPDREGVIEKEKIKESEQVIATLDFGDKLALYDFTNDQYFSWIRSLRMTVRGERGEINNKTVKYLKDFKTPVELELKRLNAGEDGNLEGYYLKGILAGNDWVYQNPLKPGRITDDEIAIAGCLDKMSTYVKEGTEFYGFAEAAQDHYLALVIDQVAKSGETIVTETQPWAK